MAFSSHEGAGDSTVRTLSRLVVSNQPSVSTQAVENLGEALRFDHQSLSDNTSLVQWLKCASAVFESTISSRNPYYDPCGGPSVWTVSMRKCKFSVLSTFATPLDAER